MIITTVILYIILTVSGILLIGSIIWFINSIVRISQSVSIINEPVNINNETDKRKEKKEPMVNLDLVEAIKHNRGKFDLENFKSIPYAELNSLEMKATNLWCGLARYIYIDEEEFVSWLYERRNELNSEQPITLLGSEEGYQQVYVLLGKKVTGVFSS